MKERFFLIIALLFATLAAPAQGKKEVKKHNIKSSAIVDIEGGKTLNNKRAVFDKSGETIEETDYDKDGNLKTVKKYKFNKEGDVMEEEEFDAKTKFSERRLMKYNALGEKTEERVTDAASGKTIKVHYYSYDSRGLKTERKTVDPTGKVLSIRKYTYEFK